MNQSINHGNFPEAIGLLLAKVDQLEKRLSATSAPPPPPPDYVTIEAALEILCGTVKRQTLYNWHSTGKIAANKIGRRLLFERATIEAMLKKGYQPIASDKDAPTSWEAVKPKKTMPHVV